MSKRKVDKYTPDTGVIDGWQFRLNGAGLVTVGTVDQGEYKKWTYRMDKYEGVSHPRACLRQEIEARRARFADGTLPYLTPTYGPRWEGAHP